MKAAMTWRLDVSWMKFSMLRTSTYSAKTPRHSFPLCVAQTNHLRLQNTTRPKLQWWFFPLLVRINSLLMWPTMRPGWRESAELGLGGAAWHCPETFQPNQNKQHTRREEKNLKQTFGSHLSAGFCAAGELGPQIEPWNPAGSRQKQYWLRRRRFFLTGRVFVFLYAGGNGSSMPAVVLSKRSEQSALIGWGQVVGQVS